MTADISQFLNLITSEHREKPKFEAMVSLVVQPIADTIQTIKSMPLAFDLDYAIGAQLDVLGLWIGQSRQILVPLTDIYFSLDTSGLGFNEGVWKGPFDSDDGLVSLDDTTYRMVLRAKIGANHWDGSIPQMYQIFDQVFAPVGASVIIQDYDDMSFLVGILGTPLTPLVLSLLIHGFFDLKPVGVRIRGYVFPSFVGSPFFGFDIQNSSIAGFDSGSWANAQAPLAPGQLNWDSGGTWDSVYFWA